MSKTKIIRVFWLTLRCNRENIMVAQIKTNIQLSNYYLYIGMIQTVVKRDGRVVGFNEQKIMGAIRKAMMHTDKGEDAQLLQQITDHISFKGKSQMTVEAIQDAVEVELMKSKRKDVAQKYIQYRNQRSIARKAKTRAVFLDIVNIKNNDVTRENANMNADTPAGMMMKFASKNKKTLVNDYLL